MPFEGTQFGRYKVSQMLGSGAMGEVYLAEDSRIRRQVAIKVVRSQLALYPDAKNDGQAARLFEREMKIISQLDHPHILPLYDYGEVEVNETTITYMVMPYRPEGSLLTWLRQRKQPGLLSPQDVATFIEQAASALHHAHQRQVVHQDVKPSNFLIRVRPEEPEHPDLLLTDFGISRFITANSSSSQVSGGTPNYMAPEQWEGNPTYASDQYALAVMTYELLTGRLPFEGGSGVIMYKHMTATPPEPSSVNTALSPAIDAVLLQALAKKPEMRFASISDFARALQQACVDGQSTIETQLLNTARHAATPMPSSVAPEAEKNELLMTDLSTVTPQANANIAPVEKQSQSNFAALPWIASPIAHPARPLFTSTVTRLLMILALILVGVGGGVGLIYTFAGTPHSSANNRPTSNLATAAQTKDEATATVQDNIPASDVQTNVKATAQSTVNTQQVATQNQSTANPNTQGTISPTQKTSIPTPTKDTTTGDSSQQSSSNPTPTPTPVKPTPTPVPAKPTPHPCTTGSTTSNPVYQGNGYAFSNGGNWRTESAYCSGRVYFAFTTTPAVANTQVRICLATNSNCQGWVRFTSVGSKLLIASGLTAGTMFHLQFQGYGATGSYTVHGAIDY
jgi:serine/threonine protein kinase